MENLNYYSNFEIKSEGSIKSLNRNLKLLHSKYVFKNIAHLLIGSVIPLPLTPSDVPSPFHPNFCNI